MRRGLRLALASLVFWAVWAGVAGLAMTIHGDCWVLTTPADAAACAHQKAQVGMAAMAVGAVLYAVSVWLWLKRARR